MTIWEQELTLNVTNIFGLTILFALMLYKLFGRFSTVSCDFDPTQLKTNQNTSLSMDTTLHLIKSRRSVFPRDLSGAEVTRTEVETLLEAANWAPTHARSEPWRYTVVQGGAGVSDFLDMVEEWYSEHMEELAPAEYQHYNKKIAGCKNLWPGRVSHLIIIGMRRQTLEDRRLPEWEEISATAASVQNLHLTVASSPDLGGYWCSLNWARSFRDGAAMRAYCGLEDEEDRVLGAFILGKVEPGKTFKGHRTDIGGKVIWK